MFNVEYGKFRGIPRYFSKVLTGLFRDQIIEAPNQMFSPPRHLEVQDISVLRYKLYGSVRCSPVIDLSQTCEGLQNDRSEPIDAGKLLEEIRQLTSYSLRH